MKRGRAHDVISRILERRRGKLLTSSHFGMRSPPGWHTNIAGPLLPIQDLPPLGFASQALDLGPEEGVEPLPSRRIIGGERIDPFVEARYVQICVA
jgi:hypothetical protein